MTKDQLEIIYELLKETSFIKPVLKDVKNMNKAYVANGHKATGTKQGVVTSDNNESPHFIEIDFEEMKIVEGSIKAWW